MNKFDKYKNRAIGGPDCGILTQSEYDADLIEATKDGMKIAAYIAQTYNEEVFPNRLAHDGVKQAILSAASKLENGHEIGS